MTIQKFVNLILIGGSHGILKVCADTGWVMTYEPERGSDGDYWDILKFDIAELRRFYGDHEFLRLDYWDILDVAYWHRNPTTGAIGYEEPELDWRHDLDLGWYGHKKPDAVIHL